MLSFVKKANTKPFTIKESLDVFAEKNDTDNRIHPVHSVFSRTHKRIHLSEKYILSTLIAHALHPDVYWMCLHLEDVIFRAFSHLQYISKKFPVRC